MKSTPTYQNKPWYRFPWPWMLMAGPFIVIIAGVVTAYLAIRSNDGLVDEDYYKQGLAINQTTAHIQNAIRLGLRAELQQNDDGTRIRILLHGNPSTVLPEVLKLRLAHPTRAGVDQNLIMRADGAGSYSGKLSGRLDHRWHVTLEDEKSEWRLVGDWMVVNDKSLQLPVELNAALSTYSSDKGR